MTTSPASQTESPDSIDLPEFNSAGCFNDCMETRSGIMFDLVAPTESHVLIQDVAAHTAKLCRFNGGCLKFYSVAEHSYLCHRQAVAKYGHGPIAYAVLLHDAVEAYCGDCIRPIKKQLPDYRELEHRIAPVVLSALGVRQGDDEIQQIIKHYDNLTVRAESHYLMASKGAKWHWQDVPLIPEIVPYCWRWEIAEKKFLAAFDEERRFQ